MTSRARMMAAFGIAPVDHFPLYVRGVHFWDERWCATRHPSYRPVIEAVAAHGDIEASWGPRYGMFLTASDAFHTSTEVIDQGDWRRHITTIHTPAGELTMVRLSSTRGMPGLQVEFPIKTLADVDKLLSIPYVPPRPDCAGFFELNRKIGERGIVMCSVPIPVAMIHALLGSDLLAIWSITERDTILRLRDIFLERCLDLLDWMLSQGVGPIFATAGEEYLAPPLAGPKDFREFVTEPGRVMGERIQAAGGLRHIHCHGSLHAILEDFEAMHANCLHPVEAPPLGDLPLAEAKRRIGHRVCLEGNIQIGDIYRDPTDTLVAKVREAIEVGAPGGGFILCPTASPHTEVLPDQAVRNYLALVETAASMW